MYNDTNNYEMKKKIKFYGRTFISFEGLVSALPAAWAIKGRIASAVPKTSKIFNSSANDIHSNLLILFQMKHNYEAISIRDIRQLLQLMDKQDGYVRWLLSAVNTFHKASSDGLITA